MPGYFLRRGKLLFAGDALSLFNGHDLACGNAREIFAFAIRPAYRYVGRGCFAQTEVHPEVALRNEGATAADLVNLLVSTGGQRDPRPDRVPARSQRSNQQRIPGVGSDIFQKRRSFAHIDDDNLQFAVVVEIPDRETARRVGSTDAGSTLRGKIKKLAVAAIPVEQAGLFEMFGSVGLVNLGIHMPIGDDQILPTIVVKVEKGRTPSQVLGIDREAGADRIVLKIILAPIAIEGVGVVGKICLEDVQQSVCR